MLRTVSSIPRAVHPCHLLTRLPPSSISRRAFSSASQRLLGLAYDLYQPPTKASTPSATSPIIFVHGLFGSKKNNRSISKVLARDLNRSIYAIDLRNHGDSPHDPRHDYTVLADDILEFMRQHDIVKPTLIGHSMGAKAIMTVALQQPEKIENIVSVDNSPVDAALKSDFGKYVQGMRKVDDAHVKSQKEADLILQDYEKALPIRQFLLTNLVKVAEGDESFQKMRIPLQTLAASLDNMADFPFKEPDVAQFKGRALFVRGTRSHYVADDTLPVIGSFFPRFELRDVEAGHWLISENPQAFREAVVEFLSEET